MNAPARIQQALSQTVVTRIVTETLPDNPDPATILDRMRRSGNGGGSIIRIAVMTQEKSGALTGAAVQEFDGNGLDLGQRSANVTAGPNGPNVELRLANATVAKLVFDGTTVPHLATQVADLWTNGILTA